MTTLSLVCIIINLCIITTFGITTPRYLPKQSGLGTTPVTIIRCPMEDCIVPDVAYDNDNNILHIVWGTNDKQAYYSQSLNNGLNYTTPIHLNGPENVTTTMGERGPKIALSPLSSTNTKDKIIHIVFADLWYPGASTYGRYVQSLDQGQTFSTPIQASHVPGIDGLTVIADTDHYSQNVVVLYHVNDNQTISNSSSSTWLYHTVSNNNGKSFNFPGTRIPIENMDGVSCSMCMMRARVVNQRIYIALRTAINNIRDFYVLNGSIIDTTIPFIPMRVPINPPYYTPICPMNGPELSIGPPIGSNTNDNTVVITNPRLLIACMSSDAARVYWASHDPNAIGPNGPGTTNFTVLATTPNMDTNARYPTVISNTAGDVLLIWQVGPMSVSGTATVKYAVYRADGTYSNVTETIGTSFSGTKATGFVGSDNTFYIVTTART